MEFETRAVAIVGAVAIVVVEKGEPIFSPSSTRVEITDEAAGEFVTVKQDVGEISIMVEEWPAIREAVDRLIAEYRDEGETK